MSEENLSTAAAIGGETTDENGKPGNIAHAAHELTEAARARLEQVRAIAQEKTKEFAQVASAKVSALRQTAADKAQDIRTVAGHQYEVLRERASQGAEVASARAKEFQHETEAYVRTNPLRAVLIALGVGFIVGILFRR